MKLSVLAVTIASIMASSAFAADIKPRHGPTPGSLSTAADKLDVIKFSCGLPLAGYTNSQAVVAILDKATVAAGQKPILNVRIAKWTGTACDWAGVAGATVQDAGNGLTTLPAGSIPVSAPQVPGAFSPDGNTISSVQSLIPIAAVGGVYCVKITKTTGTQNLGVLPAIATGAESYDLLTHCRPTGDDNDTHHNPSTNTGYLCNEGTPATCAYD